jgi:hypothetical protein
MRLNDITLYVIVFFFGVLLGTIGSVGVYRSIATRQGDAEREESEEALRKAQFERDEAQRIIDEYNTAERTRIASAEQPSGVEPPAQPAPAAAPQQPPVAAAPRPTEGATPKAPEAAPRPTEGATPKAPEAVPPPRVDGANKPAAPSGFGPPKSNGE